MRLIFSLTRQVVRQLRTFALLAIFSSIAVVNSAHASQFLERESVRAFIRDISAEHQLNQNNVAALFAKANYQQSVIEAISKPAERVLSWSDYRGIFIKQKRIDAGREFMQQYAAELGRAEAQYGVPRAVISAIIGVETFYGRITGKHHVFESLATLAFDYPPRAKFFKSELAEFIVLSQTEGWDTLAVKGSYAGAMGWPQFISSSYRQYAVDFDGDNQRDLFGSTADVIGSVANYLAVHGWQPGASIATKVKYKAAQKPVLEQWERTSLKPAIAAQTVRNAGFNAASEGNLRVMKFDTPTAVEYWFGYQNFYAITRYNHSAMYAMAVFELSRLLETGS